MRRSLAPFFLLLAVVPSCETPSSGLRQSGRLRSRSVRASRSGRGADSASAAPEILALVRDAAHRHGVEEALILGIIAVESSFRPAVCSNAGACGLMQLMPQTAASLAAQLGLPSADRSDPAFSIEAGTAYVAYLLGIFDRDERLALAAYNTGPARVQRWRATESVLPDYSERYVQAVTDARARFRTELAQNQPITLATDTGDLDRAGLRALLRDQLYGTRADETLPDDADLREVIRR